MLIERIPNGCTIITLSQNQGLVSQGSTPVEWASGTQSKNLTAMLFAPVAIRSSQLSAAKFSLKLAQ
jgi:hypothetical protein